MQGFDGGTAWMDEEYCTSKVIGRMTSEAGCRVVITETAFNDGSAAHYAVTVDAREVYDSFDGNRMKAIRVARWWMDGCPA